jgi:DNA-binding LytR/AlgR family response regulator
MTALRILVVEDELIIADTICDALEDLGYQVLEPAISYTEAVNRLEEEQPDFALLDIQLAGRRDGIDVAWKIVDEYQIPFIFLTSNSDAATVDRAKKVAPSAYLLKPFNKSDLYTSIEVALYNYSLGQMGQVGQSTPTNEAKSEHYITKGYFFVKDGRQYHKINLKDVAYLQSEHVYVKLVLLNGQSHLVRDSLTHFLTLMPASFFKIHRSYAVNTTHITSIGMTYLLVEQTELPFGKGYRAALLKRVNILS